MSAWDTGFVCAVFWLAYLGSKGHKTRWVASGTLVIALACFMRMLPHFLYGPGQDALELTLEYGANLTTLHRNITTTASFIEGHRTECGNVSKSSCWEPMDFC